MLNKVKKYIRDNKLLRKTCRVLVALSGGADSVCLLIVLRELGYDIVAAHCNFHLRGEESNRDEQFARQLCDRLDIPIHATHFFTEAYAKEQGLSVEMAARELRYDYFKKIMTEEHCEAICVAHHSDDSIETLFINLLRGTGIKGLRGIQPKSGSVVRPLLCCSREDILKFLKERGQDFVTDSSNLTTDYLRNKIRLQLIPLIQSIMPSAKETLLTTADNLREEAKVYDACIKRMEEECSYVDNEGTLRIAKEGLLRSPSPLSLLHETLSGCGFNRSQLRQILDAIHHPGRQFEAVSSDTGTPLRLVIDRQELYVGSSNQASFQPFTIDITDGKGIIPLPYSQQLHYEVADYTPGAIRREPDYACLDMAKISGSMLIRSTMPGDSFIPFGMKGRKLISDYLTDLKVPLTLKERQLVVETGGKIAWVVGRRPSNEFRTDSSTSKILILHVCEH